MAQQSGFVRGQVEQGRLRPQGDRLSHIQPAPFPLAYDSALYRNRPLLPHALRSGRRPTLKHQPNRQRIQQRQRVLDCFVKLRLRG